MPETNKKQNNKSYKDILDIIKEKHTYKYYYNKDKELTIEDSVKLYFDKNELINNVKNNSTPDEKDFSIDIHLSVDKQKYNGKLDLSSNNKYIYYYDKVKFEKNCPYIIKITDFFGDHDHISNKDCFIEFYITKKSKANKTITPEELIKKIDDKIKELETEEQKEKQDKQ